MLTRISTLIFFLFTFACATHSGNFKFGSDESQDQELLAKRNAEILNDEGLPLQEALEEDFCYDDVYATYLRDQYLHEKRSELRKVSPRHVQRLRNSLENESLFHARVHLNGPLAPYFGAMPVVSNQSVAYWMGYFKTRGRNSFLKWLVRAESYREMLDPILRVEGLPPEFLYLAMVESGFNDTAYSRARATGAWQFMKGTAQLYDLKIDFWVDERRDPLKSTIAAARYLRDLYVQFNDWYLAMAAYNAGPGKVKRAIHMAKSRDFWVLSKTNYLRSETKHYVPKVLAALNLSSNLKAHGFEIQRNPADSLPKSNVELDRPIDLAELAEHLDVPVKTVEKWNPELIRSITPPLKKNQTYAFRMPESFIEKYNSVKEQLSVIEVSDVMLHKIRKGETLSHIAKRYNVPIPQIKAINPHLDSKTLRIGKELAIPVPGVVKAKAT